MEKKKRWWKRRRRYGIIEDLGLEGIIGGLGVEKKNRRLHKMITAHLILQVQQRYQHRHLRPNDKE